MLPTSNILVNTAAIATWLALSTVAWIAGEGVGVVILAVWRHL
jgi:hypothetical protein